MTETALAPEPAPIRLDIGCGKNKREGFTGIDVMAFDGVDTIHDVRKGIPFADESVDEVHCSHFLEHLTGAERVAFINDLYRVLKWGAKAVIITPNWSHACAYGDPTHQWPPMSEWWPLYTVKAWRDVNGPHTGYTCDFDYGGMNSPDPWLAGRNHEFVQDRMAHNINSARDLHVHLTKVKRA